MTLEPKQATAPLARLQAINISSPVVAPLSFSLQAGQCLAISGPSGAGKTRLLRLLADLDEGQGELLLDGQSRAAMPAPQWRARVLFQAAESAWWLPTVMAHFSPDEHAQAADLAARLALPPARLQASLSELSTGERQRAALVRSLLKRPAVLLLDEPSSALDADNVARMESLLHAQLAQGMSMLLVTHSQAQSARLAHAVVQVSKR